MYNYQHVGGPQMFLRSRRGPYTWKCCKTCTRGVTLHCLYRNSSIDPYCIYKSLIRQVTTCGCKTWLLKHIHEQQLRVFKRKGMRKIKNQDRRWRIRTSEERDVLIKHTYTVRYTKAHRIRLIGCIARMDKEGMTKRMTGWRPIAVRRIGRWWWCHSRYGKNEDTELK